MKFICTTIIALIISFLINGQIAIAEQIDNTNQLDKDSLNNIENAKDNEKSTKVKRSEGDIFGDE